MTGIHRKIYNCLYYRYSVARRKCIINFIYPSVYKKTAKYTIFDNWDTVAYILKHKCSLSRYGDGEFKVIAGKGNGFQSPNKVLGERLRQVILATDVPNHMVGIPKNIQTVKGLVGPMNFWPIFTTEYYCLLKKLLSKDRTYLNTQFTRFYFEREDKSRCGEYLNELKKIWDNQDIVIVEGFQTRSGIGNDLYDNARSIKRILGPAKNAFDMYDEMLEAIVSNVSKEQLILLSYGMTATVLAYDLAKLGYWAIDLGHLDIEYEWYKRGIIDRCPIEGKYVNEANNGEEIPECTDPKYHSQIICDITK